MDSQGTLRYNENDEPIILDVVMTSFLYEQKCHKFLIDMSKIIRFILSRCC